MTHIQIGKVSWVVGAWNLLFIALVIFLLTPLFLRLWHVLLLLRLASVLGLCWLVLSAPANVVHIDLVVFLV